MTDPGGSGGSTVNIPLLLEMIASGEPDRVGIGSSRGGMTYAELGRRATVAARALRESGVARVVFVGTNGPAFPVAVFASARAGIPLVSLNYRLSADTLRGLVAEQPDPLVIADFQGRQAIGASIDATAWLASTTPAESTPAVQPVDVDPEAIALLLYTSGTTAAPKAAVLRHRHLAAYVLGSVEFGSAAGDEAALVSVPAYHIAGVANLLSNVYAGRRIVYLDRFTPADWLATVREEGITHAMVVPTMLARIVRAVADGADPAVPTLRSISYGGAPMPAAVIERALETFPDVAFVNAYGLTETSSTIAVLGPDDHRTAVASADPRVRARLGSVGRILPTVEVRVCDDAGRPLPPGEVGELWVSGPQVSGEYLNAPSRSGDGWFRTRDRGRVDEAGYLFVEGRADDTIIRGGENIAPAEIEDVILRHPDIADAAVVGVADEEWGQRIAAVLVPVPGARVDLDGLRGWLRDRLRGSKTPDDLVLAAELPRTDTGKLLRRQVVADIAETR
jgi:acyl-CoA synthetase (AMP-forming)/AMP-acid ligase II